MMPKKNPDNAALATCDSSRTILLRKNNRGSGIQMELFNICGQPQPPTMPVSEKASAASIDAPRLRLRSRQSQ